MSVVRQVIMSIVQIKNSKEFSAGRGIHPVQNVSMPRNHPICQTLQTGVNTPSGVGDVQKTLPFSLDKGVQIFGGNRKHP